MPKKHARLTITVEQLRAGDLCSCEACVRDGPHEPDCVVHDESPRSCDCGRTEQGEAAG